MPQYELVFVVDPRIPDEEVVSLTDEYKEMLSSQGAEITKERSWGKRRLAYPIDNLNEGKYQLLDVDVDGGTNPFPLVEQRMQQNDKVLRFLTVRIDDGRLRLPEEKAEEEPDEKSEMEDG